MIPTSNLEKDGEIRFVIPISVANIMQSKNTQDKLSNPQMKNGPWQITGPGLPTACQCLNDVSLNNGKFHKEIKKKDTIVDKTKI